MLQPCWAHKFAGTTTDIAIITAKLRNFELSSKRSCCGYCVSHAPLAVVCVYVSYACRQYSTERKFVVVCVVLQRKTTAQKAGTTDNRQLPVVPIRYEIIVLDRVHRCVDMLGVGLCPGDQRRKLGKVPFLYFDENKSPGTSIISHLKYNNQNL